MLLMIENHRSGLIWKHFMQIPAVMQAMQTAGFKPDTAEINSPEATTVYETAAYMPHQRPVYEAGFLTEKYSLASASFSDPVWETASRMVIDHNLIQTISKPPAKLDYQLQWQMLHDSESIFIRFDLHDSELHAENYDERMYHDDCIEIYLNSRNEKFSWNGEHDYQIIVSPDAEGQKLRVKEFCKGTQLTNQLQSRFQRLPEGYSAIIEIPKKAFGLAAAERFAASIAAHDVDASGTVDMKYCWFFTQPETILAEVKLLQDN